MACVFLFISYTSFSKAVVDSEIDSIANLADAYASVISDKAAQQQSNAALLASSPVVVSLLEERQINSEDAFFDEEIVQSVTSSLSELVKYNPFIDSAFIIDTNGLIVAHSTPSEIGQYEGDCDCFEQAMNGFSSISEVSNAPWTQKPVVFFTTPVVHANQEVIGAAGIRYKVEALIQFVSPIEVGDTGYAVLVDDIGNVIYHPDKIYIAENFTDYYDNGQVKERPAGFMSTTSISGERIVFVSSQIEALNLDSVIRVEETEILEPVQSGATPIFITGALCMINVFMIVAYLLSRKKQRKELDRQKRISDKEQQIQNEKIQLAYASSIEVMMGFVELSSMETAMHSRRVKMYVACLGEALSYTEKYKDFLTSERLIELSLAAMLHDIGKLAIEDGILQKAGRLTEDEFELMKEHTTKGYDALQVSATRLDELFFLQCARDIIKYHHEKWDGTGYPSQLSGEAIPLSARIMAIADVYDALVSERTYKAAVSHEEAREIIVKLSGSHFDPYIVEVFLAVEKQFKEILAEQGN